MGISLQVLYPVSDDTTFDHDDYATKNMPLVMEHFGPHMTSAHAVRGIAGGPGAPAGFYAIATMNFADQAALDAAMAAGGPVLADIPNYYTAQPQMLIGEILG